MNSYPKIDVQKIAKEVVAYLDAKKFDLVDWGYHNVETFPDPKAEETPEMNKFAEMWEEVFDHADKVTEDDGAGFPHDVIERYEVETQRIEDSVNSNASFWKMIQKEILPLYKSPADTGSQPLLDAFEKSWDTIKPQVFCDPDGNTVVDSLSVIDDMRTLIENPDLGKIALKIFNDNVVSQDLKVEDGDAFMLLCKNYADRLILKRWQNRWKAVKIFYDPLPLDVTTTKKLINKNTGKVKESEIISKRTMPPGFVIRIL